MDVILGMDITAALGGVRVDFGCAEFLHNTTAGGEIDVSTASPGAPRNAMQNGDKVVVIRYTRSCTKCVTAW